MILRMSMGALVINTGNPELKVSAYVDVVLGFEIDEDKVAVTYLCGDYLISVVALVTTIGTVALGYGLSGSIGNFVTTCSSSSV